MKARTHDVVRMLAMFRHSAQCRRLRDAAAVAEARALLNEPAEPDTEAHDIADTRTELCGPGKPHSGMH